MALLSKTLVFLLGRRKLRIKVLKFLNPTSHVCKMEIRAPTFHVVLRVELVGPVRHWAEQPVSREPSGAVPARTGPRIQGDVGRGAWVPCQRRWQSTEGAQTQRGRTGGRTGRGATWPEPKPRSGPSQDDEVGRSSRKHKNLRPEANSYQDKSLAWEKWIF